MADRRTDPARLEGAALTRWYKRTPAEVQAEKDAAERRKRDAFAASIREVEREPESHTPPSLVRMAEDVLHDFQAGPKIERPNVAQSFIPVVGPAWEAAADLQDGNYAGAAFNGAMAVADVLPFGVAAKGIKAATKGVGVFKKGSLTANAARSRLRDWGVATKGEEIHHTVPLAGIGRGEQNWRNHYALLKVLPVETHRRLTGSWNGRPRFGPIRRVWHGTTDWQKAVPAGVVGYAADTWENVARPFSQPSPGPKKPSG
jgi:hypothetical protein